MPTKIEKTMYKIAFIVFISVLGVIYGYILPQQEIEIAESTVYTISGLVEECNIPNTRNRVFFELFVKGHRLERLLYIQSWRERQRLRELKQVCAQKEFVVAIYRKHPKEENLKLISLERIDRSVIELSQLLR